MASKRRLRRKKCGNKVRHPSEAAAIEHARQINRKETNRRPGYGLSPYKCQWCHHFHVGHKKIVKKKDLKE